MRQTPDVALAVERGTIGPMGPILLVDDNYDFRLMAREFLERHGYHVISVGSGQEALEVLDKHSVSLIITDLYMPVITGFGLLRRVKERKGGQAPPVIALTGYDFLSGPEAKTAANMLGATMILNKPVDMDRLLPAIAEVTTRLPPARTDNDASANEA